MKRPFAVIGLTYLVTLAVVFHYYSFGLVTVIAFGAVAAAAGAIVLGLILRRKRVIIPVTAAALSALCAVLSLVLFQTMQVQPILSEYADQEIFAEGYIGDDIRVYNNYVTYLIHAEKIDGKECSVKIRYTAFSDIDLSPFDGVAVTLTPQATDNTQSLSRGVYLYAVEEGSSALTPTGKNHRSLYSSAVFLRQKIKRILNVSLNSNAAELGWAVLLGDRQALSEDVRRAFNETGTSYLIVVSGMHLSLVTMLPRKLLPRKRRGFAWVYLGVTAVFTSVYSAVTGLSPSVMRAGIMLLITALSSALLRDRSGLNSLGIAALALTLPHPYAAGDAGLLLSFAATAGILLWAEPVSRFLSKTLHLNHAYVPPHRLTRRDAVWRMFKKFLRGITAFFGTSLSASLWALPVTMLIFGKAAPLTVVISLVAYPLTCAFLLSAFVFVILRLLIPVEVFPDSLLIWALNTLADWLTAAVKWFSTLPFCSVRTEEGYFYVWLAVTAAAVALGYLIRARRLYIVSAVVVSVLTLTIGGSLTYLLADDAATLTVYRFGSGYTVAVEKNGNLSLLSCGGSKNGKENVTELLKRAGRLDNILLTSLRSRNASYLSDIIEQEPAENLMLCGKNLSKDNSLPQSAVGFRKNSSFTVALNSDVSVKVLCTDKQVFLSVRSAQTRVLIAPYGADFAQLPQEWLSADTLLTEGECKNTALLSCGKTLSVTGKACEDADILADKGIFRIKMI